MAVDVGGLFVDDHVAQVDNLAGVVQGLFAGANGDVHDVFGACR